MPYVYLLECADGSFYVGSAWNLDQRVREHADGSLMGHTSKRRPVRLVWSLECERIDDAFVLEHKIKGWRRSKKIALIEGRYEDLPELAVAYQRRVQQE